MTQALQADSPAGNSHTLVAGRWLSPRPKSRLATLAILALLAASAQADWPHLRGPQYDGTSAETGLAETWPAGGPPRLWSLPLGQGHSGFIVAEGKVFTQRQTLGGQYVLCLDPDSGETVWETRYDWAWQPKGPYPGPYASPTWSRGKVYYSSPTGLVGCLDAKTGTSLWSVNVREKFGGKGCEFGYAATPLVEDDKMIVPVGGPAASMVALHAEHGGTVWTAGDDPASYCPALPITFQGRRCIVGYLQNALIIVELASGKLLHRWPLSSGYDEHSAWPLYKEPHLLLASPFRVPAILLRLQSDSGGTLAGAPMWQSRQLSNDIVPSVLHAGHIYGFDLKQLQASRHRASRGVFRCLDWSTGDVRWSTDRIGQASALVADGKLYLLNDSGSLIMARADPAKYEELGRTQLFEDDVCWTPPALWRGRLFVRSPSQVVCLYVGRPEDQPQATEKSALPPTRSLRFDPAWLLSREREFPNDAPALDELVTWFLACIVLVFGGAALLTGISRLLSQRILGRQVCGSPLFWALAFGLGLLGPNLFSSLLDLCLFTWPASLYAAFHAPLLARLWALQPSASRSRAWLARLLLLGFAVACYGYFELCKAVGMFIGWSFLGGFALAFPFTLLAVRAEMAGRMRAAIGWTFVAFASFFGAAQAWLAWRSWLG